MSPGIRPLLLTFAWFLALGFSGSTGLPFSPVFGTPDPCLPKVQPGRREKWGSIAADTFQFHTRKSAIPGNVMALLKKQDPKFQLADSGAAWNGSCSILDPKLPRNRLRFFARGKHHMVLVYEAGGIGRCTQVLLLRLAGHSIQESLLFSSLPKISTLKEVIQAL